ncbi:hypothetical protein KHA80_20340 [Anaerobacillus sp. HL2]|nr:hypothetical protein KHA80_20340 [Anaerobacillus sp. HL2]
MDTHVMVFMLSELAELPEKLISRAKEILATLENHQTYQKELPIVKRITNCSTFII